MGLELAHSVAEFFFDYGLFALKAVTILVLAAALLALVTALVGSLIHRSSQFTDERLEIVKANDRLERERETIEAALLDHHARRLRHKAKKTSRKKEHKERKKSKKSVADLADEEEKRRVFVLDFDGDLRASAVDKLRRELTAVLSFARKSDEVVVRLESAGGLVHSYGLAASQLDRVKSHEVKLTVCVDKVAASGGYMMACVADQLLAAPFAVLGSIGVVAQLPNFHRLLEKNDIDFELFTAGQYKRTVTVFGKNTEQGRQKFRDDLEDTHQLFKDFVHSHRSTVDIDQVATGEIWFGRRALDQKLVDGLETSDEYLVRACEDADVLEVSYVHKQTLQDKLSTAIESAADRVVAKWWQRATERPIQ